MITLIIMKLFYRSVIIVASVNWEPHKRGLDGDNCRRSLKSDWSIVGPSPSRHHVGLKVANIYTNQVWWFSIRESNVTYPTTWKLSWNYSTTTTHGLKYTKPSTITLERKVNTRKFWSVSIFFPSMNIIYVRSFSL
jgi:hypothetical protein